MVAIRGQQPRAPFPRGFPASGEVQQRTKRADPATEEAPEKQCGDEDRQAPQEAVVECPGGQSVAYGHQRIGFEKQAGGGIRAPDE